MTMHPPASRALEEALEHLRNTADPYLLILCRNHRLGRTALEEIAARHGRCRFTAERNDLIDSRTGKRIVLTASGSVACRGPLTSAVWRLDADLEMVETAGLGLRGVWICGELYRVSENPRVDAEDRTRRQIGDGLRKRWSEHMNVSRRSGFKLHAEECHEIAEMIERRAL